MPRERKGFTVTRGNKLYLRIQYTDSQGKRRELMRRVENKTDARELRKQLLDKLDNQGEKILDGDKLTFEQLANTYKEKKLQPAEYHSDRKVKGMRNYKSPRIFLEYLKEYFGKKRVRDITHSDIEEYKSQRLKSPKRDGSERSIASVNRELELLRAVLRFAVRQGWLNRSPFEMGISVISKADEVKRDRVLSFEEEERLLAACTNRRSHIKPIVIAALDTGARRGELLQLTWNDIDFDNRLITLRATTTKTQQSRIIGITNRLLKELTTLYSNSEKNPEQLVFGITDNFKKSFSSACREAKIENFTFHDIRHTAITRMIQSGMPANLVMKVSGHTQPVTFNRYVNINEQAARQAAEFLDNFNSVEKR